MTIKEVLSRMIGKRVLVIGDMMLDKSIYYRTLRRANEFEGDIIEEENRVFYPGGAANVAMNCRSLGANVTLLGACGTDRNGLHLIGVLGNHLIMVPTTSWDSRSYWHTTAKTRVYIDGVPRHRIDEDFMQSLNTASVLDEIEKGAYDLLLLSDYQKGVFRESEFVRQVVASFRTASPHGFVAANPKPQLMYGLPRIELVSMNQVEHLQIDRVFSQVNEPEYLIRTLGSRGLNLFGYGTCGVFSAGAVDNPDVVGCGDSTFAAAALALSITRYEDLAGKIAVAAGTAKAQKKGTAAITAADILEVIGRMS